MLRGLQDIPNPKGKTVLVRTDFNVQNPSDALRFKESLPTIKYLVKKGAKVVLMSHRGRPKGVSDELSLKLALPFFIKHMKKVTFLPKFDMEEAREQINGAPNGSIFLLENLRFHKGEDACSMEFAQELASLGDVYVNDAFAVSHRSGASITMLPKLLPAYIGLLLEREIEHLNRAIKKPAKPLVVILGGGKAVDKFAVIKNLHDTTAKFLIGGVLANTFLKAKGVDIDGSVIDPDLLIPVRTYLRDKKVMLPIDWIQDGGGKVVDIGALSLEAFSEEIKKAKTIIWNGPLGVFEDKRYKLGSVALAKLIARAKAFSVIGGGETTQLIGDLKMDKKFGFLSTGGGAMLAFLAGKKLPGLDALGYYKD